MQNVQGSWQKWMKMKMKSEAHLNSPQFGSSFHEPEAHYADPALLHAGYLCL